MDKQAQRHDAPGAGDETLFPQPDLAVAAKAECVHPHRLHHGPEAAHGGALAVQHRAAAGEQRTLFTGLEVIVGEETAARVAAAWGKLPPEAWNDVMADMREHFGRGNSGASPAS